MIKSHNPQDQEIEFFVSFLNAAIGGQESYRTLVDPIIADAVRLAKKEADVYELDRVGLDIKLLLFQDAVEILKGINRDSITTDDLINVRKIITEHRHHALA